jgi:hypothetical protein
VPGQLARQTSLLHSTVRALLAHCCSSTCYSHEKYRYCTPIAEHQPKAAPATPVQQHQASAPNNISTERQTSIQVSRRRPPVSMPVKPMRLIIVYELEFATKAGDLRTMLQNLAICTAPAKAGQREPLCTIHSTLLTVSGTRALPHPQHAQWLMPTVFTDPIHFTKSKACKQPHLEWYFVAPLC